MAWNLLSNSVDPREPQMNVVALLLVLVLLGLPQLGRAQPYVEAQLGYSSADLSLGAPYNGVIDDNSVAYGIDVGLGFGRTWAAEVGWRGYGNFDGRAAPCPLGGTCPALLSDVSGIDVNILSLSIVPRFEIGEVQAFAKAGYYRANIDTEIGLPNDDFKENGLLIGAGLRWYFNEPWSVSLEATRHDDNLYQVTLGFGWGLRLLSPTS